MAVLENQNKALIEELKSLKELYCQTKNDWEKPPSLEHETIVKVIEEDVNAIDDDNEDAHAGANTTSMEEELEENDIELVVNKNIEVKQPLIAVDQSVVDEEYEQDEEELLVIAQPSTSSAAASAAVATSSVITLGNGRFLDVRKSLLLRKALVEDQKHEVVVVCTTSTPTASCIRPTTSAANDCEPD